MPDWTLTCLILAAGGGAGTLARYWLGRAVTEMKQLTGAAAAPAATWIVNAETHLATERVVDKLSLHGVSLLSRGNAK